MALARVGLLIFKNLQDLRAQLPARLSRHFYVEQGGGGAKGKVVSPAPKAKEKSIACEKYD